MKKPVLISRSLLAATTFLFSASMMEVGANLIHNPSFEEESVLFPWLVNNDAEVAIVEGGVDGNHSIAISSGYGAMRQRIDVEEIGGKEVRLQLHAKGEAGAKFGVMVFYSVPDAKRGGAYKSTSSRLIWDKELTGEWAESNVKFRFVAGATGPVTLHFFRSNKQGVVFFDHISMEIEGVDVGANGVPIAEKKPSSGKDGANLLMNGGFDEDEGQIGFPDFWKQVGSGQVRSEIPQGESRTLRIEGKLGGVKQPLELANLEKRKLDFKVRLKGVEGKFQARLEGQLSGGAVFSVPIANGIKAGEEWVDLKRTITLNVKGKIETAQLVLEKEGGEVLFVEDVSLTVVGLSAADTLALVHEKREWEYLLAHLKGSTLSGERQQELEKEVADVIAVIEKSDATALKRLAEYTERRRVLGAEIWQAAAKGEIVMAKSALPYERLAPEFSPVEYRAEAEAEGKDLVGLLGWETPFSFVVTNPKGELASYLLKFKVNGESASSAVARRQRFLDTWYTRGRTRLADPMPKLVPKPDASYSVALEPVETAKFYVELDGLRAGDNKVEVEIWDQKACVKQLAFSITKKRAPLDDKALARYDYKAFLYLGHPSASQFPDLFLDSLVQLGATSFEWELMPRPKFNEEGDVVSLDFGAIEGWLKRVAKTPLKPTLFWEARTRRWETPGGRAIPQLSPDWKKAYGKVHKVFFELAAQHGMGEERFMALVKDEPHSQDYANRPDARIQNAVGMLQSFREHYPKGRVLGTLTDYGFYEDIQAVVPYTDVVLPLWPYRDVTLKFSPEGLNARTEFFQRIFPLLKAEKEKRGLALWSYAISAGKQSDVTAFHLAYPVLGARMGMTGSSHWAYSLSAGSSWDDTDGGIVDYSMIYMGSEKVAPNLEWNEAREMIVPSIRWLALREGLRDARLFSTLETAMKNLPDDNELKQRFAHFRKELDLVAGKSGYGEELPGWKQQYRLPVTDATVSEARYWEIREELVKIYAQWAES